MKKEIEEHFLLPEGISAKVEGNSLEFSFNGKKSARMFNPTNMRVTVEGNEVIVRAKSGRKFLLSVVNAFMSHLKNICIGLKSGYEYKLELVYSHFPMTLTQKEKIIEVANVGGAKKNRLAAVVGDSVVQVKGKEIFVRGSNKEHVGQTAANLEQASKIKGKDKRVFQDGIYIVSKPKRE